MSFRAIHCLAFLWLFALSPIAGAKQTLLSCGFDQDGLAANKLGRNQIEGLELVDDRGQIFLNLKLQGQRVENYEVMTPRQTVLHGNFSSLVAAKSPPAQLRGIIHRSLIFHWSHPEELAKLSYNGRVYLFNCQQPEGVFKDVEALPGSAAGTASTPYQPGECTVDVPRSLAGTLEECQKRRQFVPRKERCYGEQAMAEVEEIIAQCYDQVAEQEHLERLALVKLTSKEQYAREIQQQKNFVQMREELCGAYKTCQGSWAQSAYSNCRLQLNGFRFRMARSINKLDLRVRGKATDTDAWGVGAQAFVGSVCELPSEVWLGSQVPANCRASVLGEIASFNGVPLPGSDPCAP